MKVRFPIAVSGTSWSAQGWSNNMMSRSRRDHDDAMASSAKEAIFETVGWDPNVTVVHWIEVEIPEVKSQVLTGKVV